MLMGFNLRRLRFETNLTQEQLGDRVGVSARRVQRWEAGTKGIGKYVLLRLCKVLSVKPYVFYTDEKSLCISNSRELNIIYKYREAEKLGVSDMIEQFCVFIVGQAKKKQCLLQRPSNVN